MAIANTETALITISRLRIHSPLNMVRPIKLHKSPAPPSLSPKLTWSPCLTVMWTRPYEPSPAKLRVSATAPSVGSTVRFTMSPPLQVTTTFLLFHFVPLFVCIKLCVCVYEIQNSGIWIFVFLLGFKSWMRKSGLWLYVRLLGF